MGAEHQAFRVDRYRADYRRELPAGYNGWWHLARNSAVVLGLGALALLGLRDPALTDLLAVPVTLLVANVAEFLFHRIPMHRPIPLLTPMFQRHVGVHHRYFTDAEMSGQDHVDFHATLTAPIQLVVVLVVAGLPLWGLTRVVFGPDIAALSGATAAVYVAVFEWLHLVWHARQDHWVHRLPGVALLRRNHQLHHDPRRMTREAFNISFPLTDVLLGTLPRTPESNDA